MKNGRATPLINSVCYVRLAVSEPSASARFVSDIFGLQRVADQDGEIAFRSDDRFRTVSLAKNLSEGASVGIEVWDDTALAEIGRRLRELGFTVRDATAGECRRRYVQSALLAEDASKNQIDLVVRPTRSGRRYFPPRDAGIVGFRASAFAPPTTFAISLSGARSALTSATGSATSPICGSTGCITVSRCIRRSATACCMRPSRSRRSIRSCRTATSCRKARSRSCRARDASRHRGRFSCMSRDRTG